MKEDLLHNELPVCGVLSGFNRGERRTLSEYGNFLIFKRDETVIQEKENQNCLYFLISGTLHALHKVEGGATPVGTIKAGEWFGEINIFDPGRASAAVVAHEEAHVWRIPRMELEEFLNEYPSLGCLLLLGVGDGFAFEFDTVGDGKFAIGSEDPETLQRLKARRHARIIVDGKHTNNGEFNNLAELL